MPDQETRGHLARLEHMGQGNAPLDDTSKEACLEVVRAFGRLEARAENARENLEARDKLPGVIVHEERFEEDSGSDNTEAAVQQIRARMQALRRRAGRKYRVVLMREDAGAE